MIHLTPRQSQVLDLLIEGLTAKQIAARLGISYRTVQDKAEAVRRKYGAKNRFQLVKLVVQGRAA